MGTIVSPGDVTRMRADAEQQFAQATQEQSKLEDKLAQVERNALLTLNNREQIHREQLEAERRQKVQCDFHGYVGFEKILSDPTAIF